MGRPRLATRPPLSVMPSGRGNVIQAKLKLVAQNVDGVALLAQHLHGSPYFRIVVPSRTPTGVRLSLLQWTSIVLDLVMPLTGGAMDFPARGHWLDGRDRRVTERVRIVECYVERPFSASVSTAFAEALAELAVRMRQDALAVAVVHRFILLRPRYGVGAQDTPTRRRFLRHAALRSKPSGRARRAG